MAKRILITGGAGLLGSHLADHLLEEGYEVRILDSLSPRVHAPDGTPPTYLSPEVEFVVGNIKDPSIVRRALRGVDAVYHLAARAGVGESMYELSAYMENNVSGTAVLLEALTAHPVERLVVTSSMGVYGEGLYRDIDGNAAGGRRTRRQLRAGDWDPRSPSGEVLRPVPTPETVTPDFASVYALSKYTQERMCLLVGQAYHIPTVVLRLSNVYGERQALSNPYAGVLAIFASRLINGKPPLIYEDGQQRRDFVNVDDVVRACVVAQSHPKATNQIFNIGSGKEVSIESVARRMARTLGVPIEPAIINKYRTGDVRNCIADISRARECIGFEPEVGLDDGITRLAGWLDGQTAIDGAAEATEQLTVRGLTV